MVPFGDLDALEQKLRTREFAAFIVEPIQSHGGINLPPEDYLPQAQRLCRRTGTLFFLDEVATGFGRTGKMFAAEHWHLEPDILTCGKGLSGGLIPISAYATSRALWTRAYGTTEKYLLHSSTFGENNLASAVALATLEVILNDDLVKNASIVGDYFLRQLQRLQVNHYLISDVRGRGLMLGVEFNSPPRSFLERVSRRLLNFASDKLIAFWIVSRLLNDFNILTAGPLVNSSVLRLLPPLSIGVDQVDFFIQAFDQVCRQVESYTRILRESSATILKRSILSEMRGA